LISSVICEVDLTGVFCCPGEQEAGVGGVVVRGSPAMGDAAAACRCSLESQRSLLGEQTGPNPDDLSLNCSLTRFRWRRSACWLRAPGI